MEAKDCRTTKLWFGLKNILHSCLSFIHLSTPSCFFLIPAFLYPSLHHSHPSVPSIKTSDVCACGRLNCLVVICNVNMWLRVRAPLPLDAPLNTHLVTHTHTHTLHIQRTTSSCQAQLCYSYEAIIVPGPPLCRRWSARAKRLTISSPYGSLASRLRPPFDGADSLRTLCIMEDIAPKHGYMFHICII